MLTTPLNIIDNTAVYIYLFFLNPQHLTVIHSVINNMFVSNILPPFRFQDECTNNETRTNEFNKNDDGKDDDHANTINIHSGSSDNIDNAKTHCKDINIVINQKIQIMIYRIDNIGDNNTRITKP